MDEREMLDAAASLRDANKDSDDLSLRLDRAARLLEQAAGRTTPDRDAVIEECAKVCDEYSVDRWNLFKGRKPYEGTESGRADPYTYGASDGADQCSERIRALKTAPTSDKGGA